ncbi:MAG: 1-(5-phosphoribosyl)-5-[Bacteroidales bacterium]|nr:1-(5-phosphoribosyl)-5-[(5-phosphoribosylamino)methylideneamino]imidazole-4-carboxamide isomerase [Bacteroidales bacterium]
MELIPAIDVIQGRCVRLSQGDYAREKVYHEHPLEVAKAFEDAGLRRVHVVDLDGAKARHIVNWKVLEQLSAGTSLTIDFGGGLKSDDDLRIAFECGASMVTGGSIAVHEPEVFCRWLQTYGSDRIILGSDVREGKIAVDGWQEETDLELLPYLKDYMQKGVRMTVCTDISVDGMLQGPSVALYRDILQALPDLFLIASGGVSSLSDLEALAQAGLPAVIFGKALYEGRIKLSEISRLLC